MPVYDMIEHAILRKNIKIRFPLRFTCVRPLPPAWEVAGPAISLCSHHGACMPLLALLPH